MPHKYFLAKKNFLFACICLLLLSACTKQLHLAEIANQHIEMNDTQAQNDVINKLIAPYKTGMEEEMNQIIARVETPLTKQKPESTLGNICADAMLWAAQKNDSLHNIDFAISNYGGLRILEINGNITRGKVFELMPFDNTLTVVSIDSTTLYAWLSHIASQGGWPISEGISMRIDTLHWQANDIRLHGKPITNNRMYQVATSDYLANGGDNCSFLIGKENQNLGILLRDILMEYFADTPQPIVRHLENRIIYEQ
ncbi:MAG: 5'-nucleotidase [Chitinophagales bacterium]|nr:5'-nucleotidase C-terminal domain-containing protein [Bacteroidota bacterium]MCB9042874.1 5'-nucleotidase C-terminal domain-containing protein [Chitinophagales bacterium]